MEGNEPLHISAASPLFSPKFEVLERTNHINFLTQAQGIQISEKIWTDIYNTTKTKGITTENGTNYFYSVISTALKICLT